MHGFIPPAAGEAGPSQPPSCKRERARQGVYSRLPEAGAKTGVQKTRNNPEFTFLISLDLKLDPLKVHEDDHKLNHQKSPTKAI